MLAKNCFPIVLSATAMLVLSSQASAQLRISQVGKSAGTNPNAFNGQFIEIFNAGSEPVSLDGKSVQWASTAGGAFSSSSKLNLSGVIAPQGYWLVRLTSPLRFGIPFQADQEPELFNGTLPSIVTFGHSAGKVAIVNSTTAVPTSCSTADPSQLIDLVSWDDVPANTGCREGASLALIPFPTVGPAGIGSTSVLRLCGGLTDTNENLADFTTTGRPPRNSQYSGLVDVPAVSGMVQVDGKSGLGLTTGYAGQSVLITATASSCTGSIASMAADLTSVGGSASQSLSDSGTNGDSVAGDGVYSCAFTLPSPAAAPLGARTLQLTAVDTSGRIGTGLVPITVAPVPPANDTCVNAEIIPATTLPVFASATGDLVSAGPITQIATNCTTNGGNAGTSRDVWYSFTPVESGAYTVTTCNPVTTPGLFTGMDTVISIHTTCPSESATTLVGQSVACNDQGCTSFIGGGASTISRFSMEAGTTYLIRVAKFGSGDSVVGAPFRLDILSESFGACCLPTGQCTTVVESECASLGGLFGSDGTNCGNTTCPPADPPTNNDCAGAIPLQDNVIVQSATFGANGSDISSCNLTSIDLWYTLTASTSGTYTLAAAKSSGTEAPALAVYPAVCPPVTDSNIACSSGGSQAATSSVQFTATAGTTYLIRAAVHFSQNSVFTVVAVPPGRVCDSLDFNNDGNIEPLDVDAYFSVLGEGPCLPVGATCSDLDFNNDGNIEPLDVDAYFSLLGEGPCL